MAEHRDAAARCSRSFLFLLFTTLPAEAHRHSVQLPRVRQENTVVLAESVAMTELLCHNAPWEFGVLGIQILLLWLISFKMFLVLEVVVVY